MICYRGREAIKKADVCYNYTHKKSNSTATAHIQLY